MRVEIDGSIDNVYIFVADALRYTSTPDALSEFGTVIKAISSSTVTCTSYPSMVTGRYPTEHGVWGFSDVLDGELATIFDPFEGQFPAFWAPNSVTDGVDCVTQYDTFPPYLDHLDGLDSPFVILDSDPSAHLPFSYDALPLEAKEAEDAIGKAFPVRDPPRERRGDFPTRAYQEFVDGDIARQRADYRRGAELAVERFRWQLELLDHFDLLENTLVIFTADHGEELGEYGLIGHGFSPVPETIHVPLLFYVPNGSVTVHGDCAALVDLLPTIGGLLGHDTPDDLPGYDLTEGSPDDRMVFAANVRRTGGGDSYMNYSAWSKDGGYCYTESGLRSRLRVAGYRLLKSPTRRSQRKRPLRVLRNEIRGRQGRFGNPGFGDAAARTFCERIRSGSQVSLTQELSEEVKHRLRSLGYTEDQI